MRAFLIPAAAIGLVAALGCGGLVPDLSGLEAEPPPSGDWVGTWTWSSEGRSATLDIAPDGSIAYESQAPNGSSHVAGPATGWEDSIQCCFGLQSFDVDAPPTEGEDHTWTMQLDGRTFSRQPRELEPVPEEIEEMVQKELDEQQAHEGQP